MLVLSSPSGAGKTTLCSRLLETEKNLTLSVSVTTRQKRPGEEEGKDYYFVSREEFLDMIERELFLEYAEVFGNFYGTPKKQVLEALAQGKDIIFDIDWQGTQQLAQLARTDLVSIFVLPPSIQELETRLKLRGQDSLDVIANRMNESSHEISHWPEYDYVIINKDLERSLNMARSILQAERLKRNRLLGLADFVNQLRLPMKERIKEK
ncbi:MAG TPA: guanylate kinase [Alphaproteobacteria bacterium]|nr:guanylate kinase [Alphaproteobacteria bacterium]